MDDAVVHYGAPYLSRERWQSYVYQVTAINDLQPTDVLEVGIGPGVVKNMIKAAFPCCSHTSIDIDPSLEPDTCASVLSIPFADNSFDAAFCCQVLEHIPYDYFISAVSELKRVTRKRIVLSLPDASPFFFLRVRYSRRVFPGLWRGISWPNLFPKVLDFAEHGQHYWEIGRRGYPVVRILSDLKSSGLKVREHFRMVERSYWHFFLLDIPQES